MSPGLSEFALIRKYFDRPSTGAVLGVGDDAALLQPSPGMELAVAVDTLNEGIHFFPGTAAAALGHKALAVNLSDMAAVGARPRWATLALSLPGVDEMWLAGFAEGLFALAQRYGVDLIGGDTTRGPLSVSITVLGELPAGTALLRSGARIGEDIWVSGALGGAALAVALRRGEARAPGPEQVSGAARRLDQPEPRVLLGERLRGLASAAIDVSDGFVADLGHILDRSGIAARVHYAQLPRDAALSGINDPALERRCVLAGGDDYELIFTADPSRRDAIQALAAELGVALTRVGVTAAGDAALVVLADDGRPIAAHRGFDHFAPGSGS